MTNAADFLVGLQSPYPCPPSQPMHLQFANASHPQVGGWYPPAANFSASASSSANPHPTLSAPTTANSPFANAHNRNHHYPRMNTGNGIAHAVNFHAGNDSSPGSNAQETNSPSGNTPSSNFNATIPPTRNAHGSNSPAANAHLAIRSSARIHTPNPVAATTSADRATDCTSAGNGGVMKKRKRKADAEKADESAKQRKKQGAKELPPKRKRFIWSEDGTLEVAALYAQLKSEQMTLEENKIGFHSFAKHVEEEITERKLWFTTLASLSDEQIMNRHKAVCSIVKRIKDSCSQTGGGGLRHMVEKSAISYRVYSAFDELYGDNAAFQGHGEASTRNTPLERRAAENVTQSPFPSEEEDARSERSDQSVAANDMHPQHENRIECVGGIQSSMLFDDEIVALSGSSLDVANPFNVGAVNGTSNDTADAGNVDPHRVVVGNCAVRRPDADVSLSQYSSRASSLRPSISSPCHIGLDQTPSTCLTPVPPSRPRALTAGASRKLKAKASDADSLSSSNLNNGDGMFMQMMMMELRRSEARAEERRQLAEEKAEERRQLAEEKAEERREKREERERQDQVRRDAMQVAMIEAIARLSKGS
ncbi:hypothetical protein BJ741DRAFT_50584 [Chytriomyces cf. hyalinus JEL632]|nr:hypothetical protein BJ741DRAFT_50584 [Chytriomyces cf. hyalinus JEL632]